VHRVKPIIIVIITNLINHRAINKLICIFNCHRSIIQ